MWKQRDIFDRHGIARQRFQVPDGVPQIVFYQAGLGSLNNWYSYFVGGYLGSGISENIREAYAFVCSVNLP